jgi:uncharacterized protein
MEDGARAAPADRHHAAAANGIGRDATMPEVMFAGPDGRLEGRYHHAKQPNAPVALVLHPHPLHGGTMNNRVVHALYERFRVLGFSVLRFNFLGVGRSQGRYDGGIGEISDAASALDFLQAVNPNAASLWVAGYSFGAYVGMQLLMRRPEIHGFISAALPANLYDFTFLAPCPSSGLIVHGDRDQLVPQEPVAKLVHKLSHQRGIRIDFEVIGGADHFFTNHVNVLNQVIESYLDRALMPPAKQAAAAAR